jgi:hypothetical protein
MTGNAQNDNADLRMAYEFAYRNFIASLQVLADDAGRQVLGNANHNTALELFHETAMGWYLIASPAAYLTPSQRLCLETFLNELEKTPFKQNSGQEENSDARLNTNLTNMLHPFWKPIRKRATQLLDILESATLVNTTYFANLHYPSTDA